MKKCKGFTLIELMVSVSILALLSIIALPTFNHLIIQTRVDSEITQLHRLLLTARNFSINSSFIVTVCPLDNTNVCTTNWQNEISVFTDFDSDKVYEPLLDEKIIRVKKAIKIGDTLEYGIGRNGVIYAPTGRLAGWGSNGTFKYCPENESEYSRGIRIAVSGRLYLSTDFDNDGRDELRDRTEITCR